MASIFAKQLANEVTDDGKNSLIIRYIKFLFPKVDTMSDKYNYAKKYRILTPLAWIHHFCSGVFHKDYRAKDKIKFALSSVNISKKHNALIKELDL